jgi:hypothetical protein
MTAMKAARHLLAAGLVASAAGMPLSAQVWSVTISETTVNAACSAQAQLPADSGNATEQC